MASGEHAADKLKGMFKGGSEASEGLRQNINSFADSMTEGHSGATNTADTREGKGAYTTGTTSMSGTHSTGGGPLASSHGSGMDGSRTVTGGSENEMGGSGFNKDAERLGSGIAQGIEKMKK